MFLHLLRLEGDKTLRRPLLWISLLLAVLPMVAFFLVAFTVKGSIPVHDVAWPDGLVIGLGFINGYIPAYGCGAYVVIIVVGVVTAQEYSWRSMQLWLSHGIPRPLLVGAKCVLTLGIALLVTGVFLLVGGVLSLILTSQLHGSVQNSPLDIGQVVLCSLSTLYGLLPYAALALLLAILSRSAVVAVGGCVLFLLAIEPIVSFLLPLLGVPFAHIAQYLPFSLAKAMNDHNYAIAGISGPGFGAAGPSNMLIVVIAIALYTLGLSGLALWIFQRQNLAS